MCTNYTYFFRCNSLTDLQQMYDSCNKKIQLNYSVFLLNMLTQLFGYLIHNDILICDQFTHINLHVTTETLTQPGAIKRNFLLVVIAEELNLKFKFCQQLKKVEFFLL